MRHHHFCGIATFLALILCLGTPSTSSATLGKVGRWWNRNIKPIVNDAYEKQKQALAEARKKIEDDINHSIQVGKTVFKELNVLSDQIYEKQKEALKQFKIPESGILKDAHEDMKALVDRLYNEQKEVIADAQQNTEHAIQKIGELTNKLEHFAKRAKQIAELIAEYADDWPERPARNTVRDIPHPDVDILLADNLVTANLLRFLQQQPRLPLMNESPDANYVLLKTAGFRSDPDWNSLHVFLTSGSLKIDLLKDILDMKEADLEFHAHVDAFEFELLPRVVRQNKRWFVEVVMGVRYVNIEKLHPWADRVIAGLVQDKIQNPVVRQDITDYLAPEVTVNVLGQARTIRLNAADAILKVQKDGLHVKVKYEEE